MTAAATLGEYALSGAMLTCVVILQAALFHLRYRPTKIDLLRAVRWGMVLLAALLSVSTVGLLKSLADDNFSLAYVVAHSERSLAIGYKIAAFWAGQEGSLLFWAWVLSLMGVVLAWNLRKATEGAAAIAFAAMAAVTGFFTCVMLFAGNPFELAQGSHTNGEGLNPMLQNLAMVAHPPLLFLGYAGFTVPFALMLGGLVSNENDGTWLRVARPWMVFTWIALTAGILLGAQWAYVELGWGGYWAWDPVENASLLPWLTGTALLHSAVLQTRRGIFKRWTASLTAASFFLCVLGTYLTRSGVIQSVHAFPQSSIGTFFLVFLVVTGLISVAAILFRLSLLKTAHPLESLFSREGFLLLGNVLLSIMTVVTLVGTIYPLISNFFGGTPITISGPFYNKVILPMALVLAALMSTGPVLGSGAAAGDKARNKLAGMLIAGIVVAAPAFIMGFNSLWALAVAATIGAVAAGIAIDLFTAVRAVVRSGRATPMAFAGIFTARSRHWGAQFAHLGLAAIVAGVAGSSLYAQKQDFQLHPGAPSSRIGGYSLLVKGLDEVRRDNHSAVVATVDLRNTRGNTLQLKPERRFYDRGTEPGQSASEVAIRPGLLSDVYLILEGWDDGGKTVTVTALINPLVNWIWIGGGLLVVGGLICMIPAKAAVVLPAPATAAPVQPAVSLAGKTKRERRRAQLLTPAATAGRP